MQKRQSQDDKQIIGSVKRGEINDFELIVKKYMLIIFNYVNKKIFNKHDVDDIVQNTFINFYKALDRFDEKRPVLPYIYEIAKNELKMYYRSHKSSIPLDNVITADESENETGYRKFEINELIKQLPPVQQKTLLLLADGYSYEEIAKKLNKPLNTIKTIIRRGRLKIMKLSDHEKTGK